MKEKTEEIADVARKIKPNYLVAIVIGFIFIYFLWQRGAFEGINMTPVWLVIGGFLLIYWQSVKPQTPRGIAHALITAEDWINFKQQRGEIPLGEIKITRDKRRHVGKESKGYYFTVEILSNPRKTYLIGVDAFRNDIILFDEILGGVVSISDEVKDIEPEKKEVLFEEEVLE